MKKTQALILHKAGIQLMQKASSAVKTKEIVSLTELAMKMLSEARDIDQTGLSSVWFFAQAMIEHVEEPAVEIKVLFVTYNQFCSDNKLDPEKEADFVSRLGEVFPIKKGQVLMLPENVQ